MKNFRLFLVIFLFALTALPVGTARAGQGTDDTAAAIAALKEQLDELQRKIDVLERQKEVADEVAAGKAKETAVVGAGPEGFYLRSADGNFNLKLRGYVQADARIFVDDSNNPIVDTFLLRRVRPIFEGTVYKWFDFRIMPDFGGGKTVLQDAYAEFNYFPEARLRAGKFKEPVGLERLQSGTDLLFVERALPTNLVPNRDIGVQLFGDLLDGRLTYQLGYFDGVADGGSTENNPSPDFDQNEAKDFAGRVFALPFKDTGIEPLEGLGLGVSGTVGSQGAPLPTYKSDGQQTFFSYIASEKNSKGTAVTTVFADGTHYRFSPQGYYYWGPFGLLGEYVLSSQEVKHIDPNNKRLQQHATIDNRAWQVAASYVVTGENASYKGVRPYHNFNPFDGYWGALEIAGRYSELRVDDGAFPVFADPAKSARRAQAWAAGVNWYFNRNFKAVVDYDQTSFLGGAKDGNRGTEKVILSRLQISY